MNQRKVEEIASNYKEQLQKLDNEALRSIIKNRIKAIEYAKKGIEEVDPENLTDENIRLVAREMQIVANMLLEERIQGRAN